MLVNVIKEESLVYKHKDTNIIFERLVSFLKEWRLDVKKILELECDRGFTIIIGCKSNVSSWVKKINLFFSFNSLYCIGN